MTRTDLRQRLDLLDAQVPQLLRDYPDRGEFFQAYAGLADGIEDAALTVADAQFVSRRLDEILCWHRIDDGCDR